jgi:hypothetical protein
LGRKKQEARSCFAATAPLPEGLGEVISAKHSEGPLALEVLRIGEEKNPATLLSQRKDSSGYFVGLRQLF